MEDTSYKVHEYRLHAAAEYELFHEWLADNNCMSIYCQFCAHLVLQRGGDIYRYQPLRFTGDDNEDRAPNYHQYDEMLWRR